MESQKKLTDSDVTLKNIEALSEENQEDWHPGECHTETTTKTVHYPVDYYFNETEYYTIYIEMQEETKTCAPSGGAGCEYGTMYYDAGGGYIGGSYSSQNCQG
jgi:hypothetical protein